MARLLRVLLATDDPESGAMALIEELCLAGFEPRWRTVALPTPDDAIADAQHLPGGDAVDVVLFARLNGCAPMAPLVAAYNAWSPGSGVRPPLVVVSPAVPDDVRAILSSGAADWVDAAQLMRLGPAVLTAIECRDAPSGVDADLLQQLIDGIPGYIYIKDLNARWTRINRALTTYLGLDDPADAIGRSDLHHFPPAVGFVSIADDTLVTVTGTPVRGRAARINSAGSDESWRWTTKLPVRNRQGAVTGLIGISREAPGDDRGVAELVEERYRTLLEQLPAVSYVTAVDSNGRALYISPQVERMLGFTPAEWIDHPGMWVDLLHPLDREAALEANRIANEQMTPLSLEYRLIARDGRIVWVRDEAQVVFSADGQPIRWQGVMFDVSDRKVAEEELRRSQRLFRTFMDNSPTVAFMKDEEGHYVYCSAPMERMFGFHLNGNGSNTGNGSRADALTDADLYPPETVRQNRANDLRVLKSGQPIEVVETITTREGRTSQWLSLKFPFTDADGSRFVGGVAIDLTERTRLEQELRRLAETDPLTGLANRAVFSARLEGALARPTEQRSDLAVLLLDLDRFKYVNDSLGHAAGDHLLVQAATRLRACLRPQDTIARLGGDEFAFLVDGDAGPDRIGALAERIITALRAPFAVDGGEAFVGGSIGIASTCSRHTSSGDLLREADIALYQAKAQGRNRAVVFHPAMNERAVRRLEQETALRHAVDRGELELHFQPVVDLRTGQPCGFEALVRWRHPERGLLAPVDFLTLAEETGLIVPVGEWVLATACRIARHWPTDHTGVAPYVAVNVSARQVRDAGLGDALVRILAETGLPPSRLTLEVTEHALIEDEDSTRSFIEVVSGLGVYLALDDFGIGYSSFGQLHTLRIDELKIDRSFIVGLAEHRHSVAIVRALAELANELDLIVTAEGIETVDQGVRARQLGCTRGQGFLFGGPLPPDEVAPFIERTRLPDVLLAGTAPWDVGGWDATVA